MFWKLLLLATTVAPSFGQQWTDLPGAATQISSRGNELWVINAAQEIYRWTGTYWERKAGAAVRVGASPDGYTWVTNAGQGIFRWNINTGAWEQIPGGLAQISAFSKDSAAGVNAAGQVFVWRTTQWHHIGNEGKWVSIGENEEMWMVGRDGTLWHWEKDHFEKTLANFKAETVDVQSASRVIATDDQQRLYVLRGTTWQPLSGYASSATITDSKLYAIVPTRIKTADFRSCGETFDIRKDSVFKKCSVPRKTIKGVNSEQCCDICRNIPNGGGCFFSGDPEREDDPPTCTICNGIANGEEDFEGATYYVPK